MKKSMISARILAIGLAAILTTGFNANARTNDDKKDKRTIPVEMKFIGSMDNKPVFEMTFTNDDQSDFTITVRDSYSAVLYKTTVHGANISRKFLLNTEELGDVPLTFEVSSKTHKTAVFEVNKYSRVVEDVVVTKF